MVYVPIIHVTSLPTRDPQPTTATSKLNEVRLINPLAFPP